MVSLADSLVASSSRPLGLRVRADLTARRQRYQGRSYWVVKEPVGLRYFRFQDEEYAVLRMMDGPTSLEDIKERFEQEFAPHKITYQDLQQFIGTLHRSGLVVSDAPGQGYQLKKRRDKRSRQELLGKLSNILAIRFKGIDPERLLTFLYPYVRWFFSPWTVGLCAALALSALLLITMQFDVFRSRLPAFQEFFGPKNWLWLGITLAVTKVLHEFGHGFLCKHFGGECHEMGVMFLVLTPCLYCNVSDSWMLPNKWQRAAIGAGGIYVELLLASLATYIWWFTEQGLVNHLALRVMFICSVSTVLFNGNPLLRFDGYYILSDVVEIPNLRQKASSILQRILAQVCLGLEMPEDPFLPQRNHGFFAIYTIAAVVYRWFIFYSILMFLNKVFEPYGLKIIGQMIALMGLFGLIVMPLWKMGKFFHVPGRMDQVKRPRLFATIGVVAILIAVFALVPFPRNVRCTLQLRARDAMPVYIEVPGRLVQVAVEPGDRVDQGDVLATLSSSALALDVTKLEGKKDGLQAQLTSLWEQIRTPDPHASLGGQIEQVEETLVSAREQLDKKQEELKKLTIVAPVSGIVLPPPQRKPGPPGTGRLATWSGSPLEPINLGAQLTPSELFCEIGDPKRLEAILAIDQADIELVKEEDEVELILDAAPGKMFRGTVRDITRSVMEASPASLAHQAGGGLATRTDRSGIQRPLSATYVARVAVDDPEGQFRLGMRGRAKIHTGYQSIAGRLWRYLTRTFHFYI